MIAMPSARFSFLPSGLVTVRPPPASTWLTTLTAAAAPASSRCAITVSSALPRSRGRGVARLGITDSSAADLTPDIDSSEKPHPGPVHQSRAAFRVDNRTPDRRFGLIASSYDRNVICEMAEWFPARDAAMVFIAAELGTICLTVWPQATDRVLLPSRCPN
jgi:hypothetical protein